MAWPWLGATPIKTFPTPVLKPMAPFFAAGLIVLYGVNSVQNAMMKSEQWKNDPRNTLTKNKGH
ncbi:putative mitochondrial F1F0 ATP synthase subunit Atp18 [Biscogniauxia marginata]|nr:putative mitochondrial F1F0 ATP synthase subunit Atp18 [Biscogniauxia marginata]